VVLNIKPEFKTDKIPIMLYQLFWGDEVLIYLKSGQQEFIALKKMRQIFIV